MAKTYSRASTSPTRDRMVFRTSDGKWANMRLGAQRPASLHACREQALMHARMMLGLRTGAQKGARLLVLLPT